MKTSFILLACISLALCGPQRRVLLDGLLDTTHLKDTVQQLVNAVGSDTSEGLCEKECHSLLSDPSNILHHSCPLICHGLCEVSKRLCTWNASDYTYVTIMEDVTRFGSPLQYSTSHNSKCIEIWSQEV